MSPFANYIKEICDIFLRFQRIFFFSPITVKFIVACRMGTSTDTKNGQLILNLVYCHSHLL